MKKENKDNKKENKLLSLDLLDESELSEIRGGRAMANNIASDLEDDVPAPYNR